MRRKNSNCSCPGGSTAIAVGLLGCALLVVGLLAPAPAAAGTTDGCMVDRFNATKPASVTDLNCTSNDVSLAIYRLAGAPTACIDGQNVTEALIGEFVATSAERWDVGAFIAVDGGTPNDLGGSCYSDFLHPVSADNTDLDLMGGFGPFYNGEITEDPGDVCGDIQQGMNAFLQTDQITFPCQDSDGDGKADIQSCTVWANSRSAGSANKPSCIDEGDVTAETTAKCTCDTVNIADLDFLEDATIIVNKTVLFADGTSGAPGAFDLEVDGTAEATDQGDGGTTDAVTVAAGTTSNPGAAHTVGESAGTGTSLVDYDSSISCDNGESCIDCISIGFVINPTDEVTCTITNQLKDPCLNVDCSALNDQCNDGVCNPDTGNCEAIPKADSTPCEDGDFCTSETGTPQTPDHCKAGECVGVPVDCSDGFSCTEDSCNAADGACINTPVDDNCNGLDDQCNDGVCDPTDPNAGTDGCVAEPKADSTPCEDGFVCTSETGAPQTPDHCKAGECVGVPVDCSGEDDQCNDGVCNADTGVCEGIPKADSTPCEDGEICTSETGAPQTPDHCKAGECVGVPVDCSGEDDQCNDGVCNADTGVCEGIPKADSTPCEDGEICTSETGAPQTPDHCKAGECVGVPVDCSGEDDQCNDGVCNADTGVCEGIPKADSTPCEDGFVCTSETGAPQTPDHCKAGECVGVPVDCSGEDDQCNDGVCNADTGVCEGIPKADSTPCEDGEICTSETGAPQTPDHCEAGECVGDPVDCSSEDDQCNVGVCNADTGACEPDPVANSTPCEDGLYCTSFGGVPGDADHCFDGTCTGTPVDCGPGDDCNTNECNEDSDACEFVPVENSTPCEDGFFCTSFGGVPADPDHCFDGTCTGDPVDCDDGFICTDDLCDEDNDQCVNEFICDQPSISVFGLVFDVIGGDAVHGSFQIRESDTNVPEIQVASQDIVVEVRSNNQGRWTEIPADCGFVPEALYVFDVAVVQTVVFWCDLDPEIVSPSGVRLTAEVQITGRNRTFIFRTSGSF